MSGIFVARIIGMDSRAKRANRLTYAPAWLRGNMGEACRQVACWFARAWLVPAKPANLALHFGLEARGLVKPTRPTGLELHAKWVRIKSYTDKIIPMKKIDLLTYTIIALSTISSGCAIKKDPGFVIVESNLTKNSKELVQFDITASPRYQATFQKIKSVSLKPPSRCQSNSASQNTGAAKSQENLISTYCGVEMSEIERSLTKQGYNVISWASIASKVNALPGTQQESGIEAARKMGSQVVFQINSLEKVSVAPDQTLGIRREFYRSEGEGVPLEKITLNPERLQRILSLLPKYESGILATGQQGAMLDINAIDAETGQSIWFYRGTVSDESSTESKVTTEFYCRNDQKCSFEPAPETEKKIAVNSELSIKGYPADMSDALYFKLIRDVTQDFASKFASGKK
ncbi:MAG: hypothetical protein U1F63_05995 [Chitinivorax sp.]